MNKPQINITPLIDVLLVLLIIFMVITPLKPSAFKTRIPAEEKNTTSGAVNPKTIVITVGTDSALALNAEHGMGTASDTSPLVARLQAVFAERVANGDISDSFADDPGRPVNDRIERTVFIKAPRHLDYGSVTRVIDAAKLAGAYPISLQIDRLE